MISAQQRPLVTSSVTSASSAASSASSSAAHVSPSLSSSAHLPRSAATPALKAIVPQLGNVATTCNRRHHHNHCRKQQQHLMQCSNQQHNGLCRSDFEGTLTLIVWFGCINALEITLRVPRLRSSNQTNVRAARCEVSCSWLGARRGGGGRGGQRVSGQGEEKYAERLRVTVALPEETCRMHALQEEQNRLPVKQMPDLR